MFVVVVLENFFADSATITEEAGRASSSVRFYHVRL